MSQNGDVLVYNQSNELDREMGIALRKDWLNVLDTSNGQYSSSQSVIDTSSLASSQRFLNYREGYLAIPLVLTAQNSAVNAPGLVDPNTAATSCDYAFGLKNSYLSLIHSFSVDLNGKNVIQQTPFCALWNNFYLILEHLQIQNNNHLAGRLSTVQQFFLFVV